MAARKRAKRTPLRGALRATSSLLALVHDGLGAVKSADKKCLAPGVGASLADSLDLDAAMHEDHPEENRWDYLLGHAPSGEVVGVEPHSARQHEITTVIRKKEAARRHLAGHFRAGRRVSRWLWVASGRVHFANTERTRRRLDEHGILFVGKQVLERHLK
ncbi:MAG: hypothetical protein HY897_18375 [Deltaproteobacteria bacterium]|nr:hypothetical protein [Deltaproteobacteria bacterium]